MPNPDRDSYSHRYGHRYTYSHSNRYSHGHTHGYTYRHGHTHCYTYCDAKQFRERFDSAASRHRK